MYAIIENGRVANIVMADAETATANGWIAYTGASKGDTWDGTDFARPALPAITAAQVKAEAGRRITAIAPEWTQRNLTAQAAVLAKIGVDNWTTEQTAEWDAGEVIWARIQAIRTASNVIERLDPIPQDYATNESRWP
jgi:hypothetical protein